MGPPARGRGLLSKSKLNGMYEGIGRAANMSFTYHGAPPLSETTQFHGEGNTYTLQINANTNTESTAKTFTYDITATVPKHCMSVLQATVRTRTLKPPILRLAGQRRARDYTASRGTRSTGQCFDGAKEQAGTVRLLESRCG